MLVHHFPVVRILVTVLTIRFFGELLEGSEGRHMRQQNGNSGNASCKKTGQESPVKKTGQKE